MKVYEPGTILYGAMLITSMNDKLILNLTKIKVIWCDDEKGEIWGVDLEEHLKPSERSSAPFRLRKDTAYAENLEQAFEYCTLMLIDQHQKRLKELGEQIQFYHEQEKKRETSDAQSPR